jgi:hypothetical protein
MVEQDTVAYASRVEPPDIASVKISVRPAGLNAAAPREINLPELLNELAQCKALIARVTIAAMAIGIALRVIK